MTIHNVGEAKAHLSRLLDAALAGEDVVVARAGRPLVRLVPISGPPPREIGFFPVDLADGFFAPLTGDDLEPWT